MVKILSERLVTDTGIDGPRPGRKEPLYEVRNPGFEAERL
jgi:hypothetical protein